MKFRVRSLRIYWSSESLSFARWRQMDHPLYWWFISARSYGSIVLKLAQPNVYRSCFIVRCHHTSIDSDKDRAWSDSSPIVYFLLSSELFLLHANDSKAETLFLSPSDALREWLDVLFIWIIVSVMICRYPLIRKQCVVLAVFLYESCLS